MDEEKSQLLENRPHIVRPGAKKLAEWQLECNLFHRISAEKKEVPTFDNDLARSSVFEQCHVCLLLHFRISKETFTIRQRRNYGAAGVPSGTTSKLNLASRITFFSFFAEQYLAVTCSSVRGEVCVDGVIKWLCPRRYHSVPSLLWTSRLSSRRLLRLLTWAFVIHISVCSFFGWALFLWPDLICAHFYVCVALFSLMYEIWVRSFTLVIQEFLRGSPSPAVVVVHSAARWVQVLLGCLNTRAKIDLRAHKGESLITSKCSY